MAAFQLSDDQHTFIDTFGYLYLPGLFQAEVESIEQAFERLMARKGGAAHDGTTHFSVAPFLNHSEYLCSLLDDERLAGIAGSLCGDDYQYWNSDGNYYVGDTRWHSDGGWPDTVGFFKIAFYLDSVDGGSGALRVIPGSHRFGEPFADAVNSQITENTFWGGVPAERVPVVPLTCQPGDAVLFVQTLKHSAFGGGTRRRIFTINYNRVIDARTEPAYRGIIRRHGYRRADVFGTPVGPLVDGAPSERVRHLAALQRYIPADDS